MIWRGSQKHYSRGGGTNQRSALIRPSKSPLHHGHPLLSHTALLLPPTLQQLALDAGKLRVAQLLRSSTLPPLPRSLPTRVPGLEALDHLVCSLGLPREDRTAEVAPTAPIPSINPPRRSPGELIHRHTHLPCTPIPSSSFRASASAASLSAFRCAVLRRRTR